VIARVWRGWTATAEDADAYERLLGEEVLPALLHLEGFLGADVHRRADGDEVEFLVVTRFESLDAVRTFAGPEYETPVIEPAARRLLVRTEPQARHYETVVELG
jgi:heme-degrading monooxygenase HmoA